MPGAGAVTIKSPGHFVVADALPAAARTNKLKVSPTKLRGDAGLLYFNLVVPLATDQEHTHEDA